MSTRHMFLALLLFFGLDAAALTIRNYYSPWNRSRPKIPRTDYIVLHTTEGPRKGSLDKVRRNGETHYFVDAAGTVYRIIHRTRVAMHCGRSMWNGRINLDNSAIGIEVEGYHNKSITSAQVRALKDLLAELQRIYKIPDERVLTHSMVAYGAPNRWHRSSHRGRKRCGMLFARRPLRLQLGLDRQATHDPDVKAGRLSVADPYLAAVLYGDVSLQRAAEQRFAAADSDVIARGRSAWDIARDKYNSADTQYVFPDGTRKKGSEIRQWTKLPPGTKVLLAGQSDNATEGIRRLGRDGATASDIAGDEYNRKTTIYFLKGGRIKRGDEMSAEDFKVLPPDTALLVGYMQGGSITADRSAFDVCGPKWNFPSTFYRLPDGEMRKGNEINENAIPRGTLVFFRS